MKRLTALLLCLLTVLSAVCASAAEFKFTIRNGDRSQKRICITVDDCADTEMLKNIFDLSQKLDVPITFFTLGYVLGDENRDVWRSIAKSNCEIGNHCYWHTSMPKMTREEIIQSLGDTQKRLDEILGFHYPIQVMRPPYGNTRLGNESNIHVVRSAQAAGYDHAIHWDVTATDPDKCLRAVKNGSILLFHTLEKDWHCLEEILPVLKEEGYEFVTVSEMIGKDSVVISEFPAQEETDQPAPEAEPEE